jgi:hypothetical protein
VRAHERRRRGSHKPRTIDTLPSGRFVTLQNRFPLLCRLRLFDGGRVWFSCWRDIYFGLCHPFGSIVSPLGNCKRARFFVIPLPRCEVHNILRVIQIREIRNGGFARFQKFLPLTCIRWQRVSREEKDDHGYFSRRRTSRILSRH